MTSTFTSNPYQPPQTLSAESASPNESTEVSWKVIAKRWEILRIPYNLVVGLTGLLALAIIPSLDVADVMVGVFAYGVCANVMYLLGPVTEMYSNWFVDAWERQFVPKWVATLVRSRYPTLLLFIGGCLFSVALTIALGMSAATGAHGEGLP